MAARLCVLLRNGFLSRRQRLRQLPDLPHAHPLHLLRGERGIERLCLQKCTVLAIGQPGLVRKGYLFRLCRTAEGVLPSGRAAFQPGQQAHALTLVLPHHRQGNLLAARYAIRNSRTVQYLLDGFGVVLVRQCELLHERPTILVVARDAHHPVKAVHAQFEGGIHIDADDRRRGEVQTAHAAQRDHQAGQRRRQTAGYDPAAIAMRQASDCI